MKKNVNVFERGYLQFLRGQPGLKDFRDRIDAIMEKFPHENIHKLRKDIESKNDEQCKAAITELLIFDILHSIFDKVEVEPIIKGKKRLTPDFRINDEFIVEVATVFSKVTPFLQEIYETINQIPSNFVVIFSNISNLPKTNPKVSEVKNLFRELFDDNSELMEGKSMKFDRRSKQGIEFSGTIMKTRSHHPNVAVTMSDYSFEDKTLQEFERISKRIKAKTSKYVNLKVPIFVVIEDKTDIVDDQFWKTLMYEGNDKVRPILTDTTSSFVCAILVRDYDTGFLYKYYENKVTKGLYDRIKSQIMKAFKVRGIEK